ncbi:hypothetical protein V490_04791 [Pseudogymnoascus sp. VKM F-3557]|nr:hypothetical protein V490_04791 [Pseudogymnoascus sp. VKM F-3557]
MDPLSIAASVVALCSAGKVAYNIADSLYRSSDMVNGAGEDIKNFAMEVDNFGTAMGTAYSALEPRCTPTNSSSCVVRYLIQKGGLKSLAKQSKRLMKHIKKRNPDIRARRGKLGLVTRVMWTFQRKEVDALRLRMESVKSNLQLIISSITLEEFKEKPHSTDNEKHIKLLYRQIRVLVRTIGILQEQQENHPHPILETDRSPVLVDLGLSMVNNGTVPNSPSSLSSSSSSIRSMHPLTPLRSSTTSISTSHSKPVLNPPRENLHPQPPISQSMEITRTSQPLNLTRETQLGPTDIEMDTAASQHSQSSQGDFINVYENSDFLDLNPSHQLIAEAGYIITPKGPVSTTALIDPSLGENLISQSYAIRLGLDINDLDAEEEIDGPWVNFGDGQRQRPIGQLRLEWNDGLLARGQAS